MNGPLVAVAVGIGAPWTRRGLATVLWLARLLPILLVFALPAFEAARAKSAHHPDARLLLEPASDPQGFAFAWLSDFGRADLGGAPETLFWLILLSWLLVTVLSGGIVARLLPGAEIGPSLWTLCGYYAGRLLRLALLAAVVVYALDLWLGVFLKNAHEKAVLLEHTEDVKAQGSLLRGMLLLSTLYLLGLVHAYARIDLVTRDRRSAVLSLLRGLGTLVFRFPSLLVVEVAMLLATGGAILLAWMVTRKVYPLRVDSTWISVGVFLALLLFFDYVRTGLEVGAMAARCRLLAPPPPSHASPVPPEEDLPDELPPLPLPNV